jgi:hypothetical protein
MATITIDRVRTRYRGPATEISRVRRTMTDAFDRVVEGAIEGAGVPLASYVCIRRLQTSVTFSLREPDSHLAARLGRAIADAVANALSGQTSPRDTDAEVVFYRSMADVLIDITLRATSGDFTRSWAWAQIGIWGADFPVGSGAAMDLVMRALAREPRAAVAVVEHATRIRPALVAVMMTRATADAWTRLVRAIAMASGLSSHALDALDDVSSAADEGAVWRIDRLRPFRERAARLVARSTIAQAARTTVPDADDAIVRALAAIVLLEVEPAAAQGPADRVTCLRSAVEHALRIAAAQNRALVSPDDACADPGHGDATPDAMRVPPSDRTREQHDATAEADAARPLSDRRDTSSRDDERADESRAAVTEPLAATTDYGGLLYLINVANRIDLATAILRDKALAVRGVRWPLHQLAQTLGLDAVDPAALAFAGLEPDRTPPSHNEAPPTASEMSAIAVHRAALVDALRVALDRPNDADDDLLTGILRRPACITADPGWIDARFSLSDVSIDIRRAGLDLDPGWTPWLGVVVRFVYA